MHTHEVFGIKNLNFPTQNTEHAILPAFHFNHKCINMSSGCTLHVFRCVIDGKHLLEYILGNKGNQLAARVPTCILPSAGM